MQTGTKKLIKQRQAGEEIGQSERLVKLAIEYLNRDHQNSVSRETVLDWTSEGGPKLH